MTDQPAGGRAGGTRITPGEASMDGGEVAPADGGVTDAERAQDQVGRLRRQLLGGHGPGASDREVARHTRERPTVGAVPMMIERELVQVRTDLARSDPAAIEQDLERTRARLTATIEELTGRLAPRRLATQAAHAVRTRIEALPGGSAQPPAPGPAAGRRDARPPESDATAATPTQNPLGGYRPVEDEQWRRVAAAAAGLGAAATLGLGLLILTVHRRLNRRPTPPATRPVPPASTRPPSPTGPRP